MAAKTQDLESARAAISTAMLAMYDTQGLLNLVQENGAMDSKDFDENVASAIRMIHHRMDSALKELSVAGF